MSDALFDFTDDTPHGFRMESWRSVEEGWYAMDEGVAPKVWKPRATAPEAAAKCLEWTGLACIPAMRVIDLSTGVVVWQDTTQYPEAGEPVLPEWDASVRFMVRETLKAQVDA